MNMAKTSHSRLLLAIVAGCHRMPTISNFMNKTIVPFLAQPFPHISFGQTNLEVKNYQVQQANRLVPII